MGDRRGHDSLDVVARERMEHVVEGEGHYSLSFETLIEGEPRIAMLRCVSTGGLEGE